jgi:hypothetical protein
MQTWYIIISQKLLTFQTGDSLVNDRRLACWFSRLCNKILFWEHSQEKRAVLPHFCIPKVPEPKPH